MQLYILAKIPTTCVLPSAFLGARGGNTFKQGMFIVIQLSNIFKQGMFIVIQFSNIFKQVTILIASEKD